MELPVPGPGELDHVAATSPRLLFRSSIFAAEAGEDEETNPGIFGRSLARWIGRQLVPGFSEDQVIAEDFGWLVPVPGAPHSLFVACSSTDATADEWQILVFAEGGLLSRLLGKNPLAESVEATFVKVRERISEEPRITGLRQEA